MTVDEAMNNCPIEWGGKEYGSLREFHGLLDGAGLKIEGYDRFGRRFLASILGKMTLQQLGLSGLAFKIFDPAAHAEVVNRLRAEIALNPNRDFYPIARGELASMLTLASGVDIHAWQNPTGDACFYTAFLTILHVIERSGVPDGINIDALTEYMAIKLNEFADLKNEDLLRLSKETLLNLKDMNTIFRVNELAREIADFVLTSDLILSMFDTADLPLENPVDYLSTIPMGSYPFLLSVHDRTDDPIPGLPQAGALVVIDKYYDSNSNQNYYLISDPESGLFGYISQSSISQWGLSGVHFLPTNI
jgi:hypothetical protein